MTHEEFVAGVRESANSFNPNSMSKEDSIMRILTDNGLSKEFEKNPTIKKDICRQISTILAEAGVSRITLENLDNVRDTIISHTLLSDPKSISFLSTDDSLGTISTVKDDFSLSENGDINHDRTITRKGWR